MRIESSRGEERGTLLQENQWWNRRKFDIFDFQNNTQARTHCEAEIREEKVVSNCDWKTRRQRRHTEDTQLRREVSGRQNRVVTGEGKIKNSNKISTVFLAGGELCLLARVKHPFRFGRVPNTQEQRKSKRTIVVPTVPPKLDGVVIRGASSGRSSTRTNTGLQPRSPKSPFVQNLLVSLSRRSGSGSPDSDLSQVLSRTTLSQTTQSVPEQSQRTTSEAASLLP